MKIIENKHTRDLLLKLQQRQLDILQPRPLLARHVLGLRLRQELGIEGPGLEDLLFLFLA